MPTIYPSLSIRAPRRLEMFKREAAQPNWVRPMTWRDVRFANLRSVSGLDAGRNDNGPVWYTQDGPAFDREIFADEILSLDHRGWFSDADCDETVRGLIVRLPHGRFLAGYLTSSNDERVYYPEVYDDEREAAHAAEHYAERLAEDEREYSEKWQRARDIETEIDDALNELRTVRADHSAFIVSRRSQRAEDMRDRAAELIESIRTMRAELSELPE